MAGWLQATPIARRPIKGSQAVGCLEVYGKIKIGRARLQWFLEPTGAVKRPAGAIAGSAPDGGGLRPVAKPDLGGVCFAPRGLDIRVGG